MKDFMSRWYLGDSAPDGHADFGFIMTTFTF